MYLLPININSSVTINKKNSSENIESFFDKNNRMYFSFSSAVSRKSVVSYFKNKFVFLESNLIFNNTPPDNNFIKPIYRRNAKVKSFMEWYIKYKNSDGCKNSYLYVYSDMLRGVFKSNPEPDKMIDAEYFFLFEDERKPFIFFQMLNLFKKPNFYALNDRIFKISNLFKKNNDASNLENLRLYSLSLVVQKDIKYDFNRISRDFGTLVVKETLEYFYSKS